MDRKQEIMALWKSIFHDSDEFIHLYFDSKYSPEDVQFHEIEGEIASAVLAPLYTLSWEGAMFQAVYFSGVCTADKFRNQRIAAQLLERSLQKMACKGIPFSFLIPAEEWLFDYYEKLGFSTVFYYSTEDHYVVPSSAPSSHSIHCPQVFEADFAKQSFPYFNRKLQERSCTILHPADDYEVILQDVYLSGGRVATCCDPVTGAIDGWAIASPEQNVIRVKELFCDSSVEKEALFSYFSQLWQIPRVECRVLAEAGRCVPYGMIRIMDVFPVLEHVALLRPDLSVSFHLYDGQIPCNTGVYVLSNGECRKQVETSLQTIPDVDITTLTQAVFGEMEVLKWGVSSLMKEGQPCMNLMID